MSDKNSMVAVYNTHQNAEAAVKELQKSGFDIGKLSILGKGYHTEEHVIGYYNTGDRMKQWVDHTCIRLDHERGHAEHEQRGAVRPYSGRGYPGVRNGHP